MFILHQIVRTYDIIMTSGTKVWNWHLCKKTHTNEVFVCAKYEVCMFYRSWLTEVLYCKLLPIIDSLTRFYVFLPSYAVDQELYKVITYNLAHKLISVLWFQICSQIFKIWSLWRHITENVHFASNCRTYDIIMTSGTKVWNWHLCKKTHTNEVFVCAKYDVCMFCRSWLSAVLYAN